MSPHGSSYYLQLSLPTYEETSISFFHTTEVYSNLTVMGNGGRDVSKFPSSLRSCGFIGDFWVHFCFINPTNLGFETFII